MSNTTGTSTATSTGTNLFANPSVETASTTQTTLPLSWTTSKWGTNTTTFTYPATPAQDGAKAVKITTTAYTSGDMKWLPVDVLVSPNKTYKFTHAYQANVTTSIDIRYTSTTGVVSYVSIAPTVPVSAGWTQDSYTFTTPANVKSLTVMHLLEKVGTLTVDNYSLVDPTATSTPDTTPPTVSITSPTTGSTVSGTQTVTATSSDNVGVVGVKFYLDSTLLGSEDTTSPYTASWNTASSTNGAHTLLAVARDVANNIATSSVISVTVSNTTGTSTATSTPANLIANPSLHIVNTLGNPTDWFTGGWGTNNAVYSYNSATSSDGASAAKVVITSYTDGDAKWFFKDVAIVPGITYDFSDYYQATVPTNTTIRYTMTNGTFVYVDGPVATTSTSWSEYKTTITPPAGAVSVTVFHKLASVGTLSVDSYSLTQAINGTNPNLFTQGLVSLTFDDGWISHYTNALPLLNSTTIKASFAIISQETIQAISGNRVVNSSFETVTASGTPVSWTFGTYGTNDATSTFPVQGQASANAAQVAITVYTDGDAKWVFDTAGVIQNQDYSYTENYKATATTTLTAVYKFASGPDTIVDIDTLAPSTPWKAYTKIITMLPNTTSVQILHRLTGVGTLTVDDVTLDRVQVFVDPSMVLAMQSAGHEISSHTQTHSSLITLDATTLNNEVATSKSDLLGIGVNTVNTFVYPYGDYNANVIQSVKDSGYTGARSVDRGYNDRAADKYTLKIQQVDVTTTPAQIQTWIDKAITDKTWLILMYHQIDTNGTELSNTPANFQSALNYITTHAVTPVTLRQGVSLMNP